MTQRPCRLPSTTEQAASRRRPAAIRGARGAIESAAVFFLRPPAGNRCSNRSIWRCAPPPEFSESPAHLAGGPPAAGSNRRRSAFFLRPPAGNRLAEGRQLRGSIWLTACSPPRSASECTRGTCPMGLISVGPPCRRAPARPRPSRLIPVPPPRRAVPSGAPPGSGSSPPSAPRQSSAAPPAPLPYTRRPAPPAVPADARA